MLEPVGIFTFTKGCLVLSCWRTWTVTREGMLHVSSDEWGRQRCPRHRAMHNRWQWLLKRGRSTQ